MPINGSLVQNQISLGCLLTRLRYLIKTCYFDFTSLEDSGHAPIIPQLILLRLVTNDRENKSTLLQSSSSQPGLSTTLGHSISCVVIFHFVCFLRHKFPGLLPKLIFWDCKQDMLCFSMVLYIIMITDHFSKPLRLQTIAVFAYPFLSTWYVSEIYQVSFM